MSSKIKLEEIPDEIREEVIDYAEYLMEKYKKIKTIRGKWLKNVNRGRPIGEMASVTVEKTREEERW